MKELMQTLPSGGPVLIQYFEINGKSIKRTKREIGPNDEQIASIVLSRQPSKRHQWLFPLAGVILAGALSLYYGIDKNNNEYYQNQTDPTPTYVPKKVSKFINFSTPVPLSEDTCENVIDDDVLYWWCLNELAMAEYTLAAPTPTPDEHEYERSLIFVGE